MTHVKFTTESGKVVAFPRALIVLDEIGENEPCYIATVSDKTFPKVLSKAEYNRLLALLTSPEPEQREPCIWEPKRLRGAPYVPRCAPLHRMGHSFYDNCPFCGGRVVLKEKEAGDE